jgi:hypothetical protein
VGAQSSPASKNTGRQHTGTREDEDYYISALGREEIIRHGSWPHVPSWTHGLAVGAPHLVTSSHMTPVSVWREKIASLAHNFFLD